MPFAVLAVIPARSGSKGIPNKNLAPLCGRPLIAHTADAVRRSTRVTRAVVSTDSPAIAEASRALGLDVPFIRPGALAADDTPMLPVLQHALREVRGTGFNPDAVIVLQPTSPLRSAEHIDAAIALLEQSGADSVVSVIEVPHQFNPVSVMRLDGDRLRPFVGDDADATLRSVVTRRQDKPRVFARNGPAVLAARVATIDGGSLYGDDCRPLLMSAEESLDIDSPWDLLVAECVLGRRLGNVPTV
jgi:CMP-N-acetylneuraminic acid synthetase